MKDIKIKSNPKTFKRVLKLFDLEKIGNEEFRLVLIKANTKKNEK